MVVIRSSDFENLLAVDWDVVVGTPTRVGAPVFQGSWACEINAAGEGCQWTESGGEAYMRARILMQDLPSFNTRLVLMGIYATNIGVCVIIENVQGVYRWRLARYDGAAWQQLTSVTPVIAIDTWYCVRIHYERNVRADLWVNDDVTPLLTGMSLQNADYNTIVIGNSTFAANDDPNTEIADNCIAATTLAETACYVSGSSRAHIDANTAIIEAMLLE